MNLTYDLVIIGSGPTGLYGAFYACLKKLKVLILESNSTFGGAPKRLYPDKPLYDIPACLDITGAQLVNNMYKQLETVQGWEIKYNINIDCLNKDQANNVWEIATVDKQYFKTKNIIFATGYGAFNFVNVSCPIAKEAKSKIFNYVESLEFFRNKNIVICGGGDSAIDYANALKSIASKLAVIHRRHEFKAKPHNVELLTSSKEVDIHTNKTIEAINDDHIVIIDNESNHIHKINFDYILVLYGTEVASNNIKLDNLFSKSLKIDVDNNYESIHHKNIYACGLATSVKQPQTILTGIADIIRVIEKIDRENKN